jgi:PhnB protein
MTQPNLDNPPPLVPHLVVDGAADAIDFYARAFGAEELTRQATPDGKKLIHAALRLNGSMLLLCDDFPEMRGGMRGSPAALGGSPVTLHLDVPDVDAAFARALAAGAQVRMPLADMFWGDRYGKLRDPFGHEWSLATRKHAVTQADRDASTERHFGGDAERS